VEDFGGLVPLREQAVLLLRRSPWGFGIDQESEYRFARALGGVDFEPGYGALSVSAEVGWQDVAVR